MYVSQASPLILRLLGLLLTSLALGLGFTSLGAGGDQRRDLLVAKRLRIVRRRFACARRKRGGDGLVVAG